MQEVELYKYWEHYALSGEIIRWDGQYLKVLHAGTLNEHNGPDFQYARFQLNDVIYQGAVEFHVQMDDWYRHKHHFDPAYQDVQLHLVAEEPEKSKRVQHNLSKRLIPTFHLKKPRILKNKISCFAAPAQSVQHIKIQLQQLALDRLKLKTKAFNKILKNNSEHAAFYQGFFRILGYPFNKSPFEMLALKIPALIYEKYKHTPILLMAIYFGCSGFLHGSFKDDFALQLQKLYSRYEAVINASTLDKKQWQMSATRPLNHPHFRLAAWVAFLSSLRNHSPFNYLYQLLEQRHEYQYTYGMLQDILILKTAGYWQEHFALEKRQKQKKNNVFLGQERINELITNLIIPICLSNAYKNNNLGFVSYLQDFYLWMPGKCNYTSLFRKRPWLKEYQNIWQSCNTGQAFLYLDDVYCSRNRCNMCPLGRIKEETK